MNELSELINKVHCMDALDLMRLLPDASVDAVITDLPYGTTACSWDTIIPFEPMWAGVKRILKPRGVFVTTASQPFTSKLVCSNLAWFKYCWYWKKSRPSSFVHSHNMPLKIVEEIAVFSSSPMGHISLLGEARMNYNPQELIKVDRILKQKAETRAPKTTGIRPSHKDEFIQEFTNYPDTLLSFESVSYAEHPTQKPAALYEYLIRTYTQPGELVLDFCAGSGTTGLAARNTGRRYILGDSSAAYCEIARERLKTEFASRKLGGDVALDDLPLFATRLHNDE